jgi:hypothetical protein
VNAEGATTKHHVVKATEQHGVREAASALLSTSGQPIRAEFSVEHSLLTQVTVSKTVSGITPLLSRTEVTQAEQSTAAVRTVMASLSEAGGSAAAAAVAAAACTAAAVDAASDAARLVSTPGSSGSMKHGCTKTFAAHDAATNTVVVGVTTAKQQSSTAIIETKRSNLLTTLQTSEVVVRDASGAIVSQQSVGPFMKLSEHSKAGIRAASAAAGEYAIASMLSSEAISVKHFKELGKRAIVAFGGVCICFYFRACA